jgi:thiol-disulfide isomerase/thioredoxin
MNGSTLHGPQNVAIRHFEGALRRLLNTLASSRLKNPAPAAIFLLFCAAPSLAQLKWQTSVDAAKQAQAKSGKPIFVDFMASWCGPCRKMDAETFSDPRVQALMKKMELVRLDVDKRPPLAKTYGVNSIPRMVVLSTDGKLLLDLMGYMEAEEFAGMVRPVLAELGMAPPETVDARQTSTEADQVRSALTSHAYASLKASNPKLATTGLSKLAEGLGAAKEPEYKAALELMRQAGNDAVPAFIGGLASPHLAVRAGCYRALQETLKGQPLPSYDPWLPAKARKARSAEWAAWWASRSRASVPRR